jgi:hypothetical protein
MLAEARAQYQPAYEAKLLPGLLPTAQPTNKCLYWLLPSPVLQGMTILISSILHVPVKFLAQLCLKVFCGVLIIPV